jgi:prepilin-type N-terminal cleavage/methylation domain-containing protein
MRGLREDAATRGVSRWSAGWGQSRLQDDASDRGFTLVELLVTIVIILAVMIPITTVIITTLNVSASNASRQAGAVLATSVISKLEAAAYPSVGFSSTALGNAPASYGATTPDGGTTYFWTTPSGSSAQLVVPTSASPVAFTLGASKVPFTPVMTITTAGNTFTVKTYIYWDSASVATCPTDEGPSSTALSQAYKHVYVIVTWQNGGLTGQKLSQDSVIYPGGQGPYNGPTITSTSQPATPTGLTAIPIASGEISVSWSLPSGWTTTTSCFAIGWSDLNNVGYSTGLLANSSLAVSNGTATYNVSGLQQGGSFVFYVTAYSPNGVLSAESADSPSVTAPTGPVITNVTPNSGGGGATVTISGTGFTTPTMNVEFCPAGVGLPPCSGASWLAASCTSQTTCTVIVPAPLAGSPTGVFDAVAETPTGKGGAEIFSPLTTLDEYTYAPTVVSVNPSANPPLGNDSEAITITGTYLFNGSTFIFVLTSNSSVFYRDSVINCISTTSCSVTLPGLSSTPFASTQKTYVYALNGNVTSPQNAAATYTW